MNAITPRRALTRERRREIDAELVRQQSIRDEELAPAAQREPILQDGVVIREARLRREKRSEYVGSALREIVRFRVADVLDNLYLTHAVLTGKPVISYEAKDAARRYCEDFERGHEGGIPGTSQRMEGGRTSSPSFGPAAGQLDSLARYRGATQAMGMVLSNIVIPVVLSNFSPTALAERSKCGVDTVLAGLRDGLARLIEFYNSKPEREG